MILFHYIPGTSILHKTNPGVKFIITLVYSILIFLLNLPILCIILSAEILLLFTAGIGIKQILKELKRFFLFLLIIFMVRVYSANGLLIIGKILPVPSVPGIISGGYIILRLCMVIFLGLLFTSTTKTSWLQNFLHLFFSKIPFIPAARLAFLLSLTIGSLPLILDKAKEVDEAQKARCIQSNRNPVLKIKSFTLPLFIHVIKQADDIACAMEARCYTEDIRPLPEPLRGRDYSILIVSICAGIIALAVHYLYPFFLKTSDILAIIE